MAYFLFLESRYDEASVHLREVLRINPKQYPAHNYLRLILKKQGRIDEAVSHFNEALRLKPDYLLAMRNLQQTIAEQGDAGFPVNK